MFRLVHRLESKICCCSTRRPQRSIRFESESEKIVQFAIDKTSQGRTTVTIAPTTSRQLIKPILITPISHSTLALTTGDVSHAHLLRHTQPRLFTSHSHCFFVTSRPHQSHGCITRLTVQEFTSPHCSRCSSCRAHLSAASSTRELPHPKHQG